MEIVVRRRIGHKICFRYHSNQPPFKSVFVSRYEDYPIERLRRKVWIRALRIEFHRILLARGGRGITTWAGLERKLLEAYDSAAMIGRLQGILGVVHRGNDPRRLVRRIREDDLGEHVPAGAKQKARMASGRKPPDGAREEYSYWEIPIDLVDAGEKQCPGSSQWEDAYLWALAYPVLPRLEELRATISDIKLRMDILSPSLDQYRSHLPDVEFEVLAQLSHQEQVDRYEASLAPLANTPTANSLSLLAALVAESFITDQDVLLELHRHAFNQGVEKLLTDPLMEDIAQEFHDWVALTVLTTAWRLPATYHVSALSEPFVPLESWEKIIRESDRSWAAIILDSIG